MARLTMPEFDDVAALPRYLEARVPADFVDANGHLNVTGFLSLHDRAGWALLTAIGMGDEYRTQRRMSFFDLEHHLRYLSELRADDAVTVHGRIMSRTEKMLHGQFFILDRANHALCSTLEYVSIHVSLETRRSTPWPDDVAATLDELIGEHSALPWTPPLSGAMHIS